MMQRTALMPPQHEPDSQLSITASALLYFPAPYWSAQPMMSGMTTA
jgi:hypothetical protein